MDIPFTHLAFDKYLLNAYYVPGTIQGARNTLVNRTDIVCLHNG